MYTDIHIDPEIIPIPRPSMGTNKGGLSKYPYLQLAVGQSFFVKGANSRSFAGTVRKWELRHPHLKFRVRGYISGVRVWRVEP